MTVTINARQVVFGENMAKTVNLVVIQRYLGKDDHDSEIFHNALDVNYICDLAAEKVDADRVVIDAENQSLPGVTVSQYTYDKDKKHLRLVHSETYPQHTVEQIEANYLDAKEAEQAEKFFTEKGKEKVYG